MARIAEERQTTSGSEEVVGVHDSPPLVFAGALFAGLLLQRVLPLPFLPGRAGRLTGGVLLFLGPMLAGAAVREMRRTGTSPRPNLPTTSMVTTGPYRVTRNPIYVGMTLLYAGIATLANVLWPMLFLPAALVAISQGMVEREERYLERRFGEAYSRYKAHVRRWI